MLTAWSFLVFSHHPCTSTPCLQLTRESTPGPKVNAAFSSPVLIYLRFYFVISIWDCVWSSCCVSPMELKHFTVYSAAENWASCLNFKSHSNQWASTYSWLSCCHSLLSVVISVIMFSFLFSYFAFTRVSSGATLWPWYFSAPHGANCGLSSWSPTGSILPSVLPSVQPTAVRPAAGHPGYDTLPWTGRTSNF